MKNKNNVRFALETSMLVLSGIGTEIEKKTKGEVERA